MRAPTGLMIPAPRLVRRLVAGTVSSTGLRLDGVFSSVPSVGKAVFDDVLSVALLLCGRVSAVAAVAFAPAPCGTTWARQGERGANTPASRNKGNLGGGMIDASLAKKAIGSSTKCVAPLRRGLRKVGARRRARLSPGRFPSAPFRTRRAPFVMHRALHRWGSEMGWLQPTQTEGSYAYT
jgi:hypothetical protein